MADGKKMEIVWNLPNVLTMTRIVIVPAIVICILINSQISLTIAVVLYILSAVTDAIDGKLARKLNAQTEFGAFLDPLADKVLILTLSALFALIPSLYIPIWLILLMLIRDIAITQIRRSFKKLDVPFKTSFIAKLKTTVQMVSVGLILGYLMIAGFIFGVQPMWDYSQLWKDLSVAIEWMAYVPVVLMSIAVAFTVYTGIDYVVVNRAILFRRKTNV